MQRVKAILIVLMVAGLPFYGWSAQEAVAQATTPGAAQATPAAHGEEAMSAKPLDLWSVGPFKITNSMLVTWIAAVGLIVFAQVATRQIRPVPEGAQNFWEWMVEGLYHFLEDIIGHDLVLKTFWFFASI